MHTSWSEGFRRHRDGAVAVEYVLLVAGIGLVVLVAILLFGEDMASYWNALDNSFEGAKER